MSHSPEQMRKKEAAQQEAERHALYARADGSMASGNTGTSPAIKAAGRRVEAATAKENKTIGGENASINDNRY